MLMVNQLAGFGAYQSSAISSVFGNVVSNALGTNDTISAGFTFANAISPSGFVGTPSPSGSLVRVTFKAGTGGWTITKAYIGQKAAAGDAYDITAGTIRQITFDTGSASSGAISAGATKLSDTVAFDFDPTKGLVVKVYSAGALNMERSATSTTGMDSYFLSGDDAATENGTGYSSAGTAIWGVTLIETNGF